MLNSNMPGQLTKSVCQYNRLILFFSVYKLTEPDRPWTSVSLQPQDSANLSFFSPTRLNIGTALGETAVSFTFGPAQELQPAKRPFQSPKAEEVITVWPVYFVKGNGDIMLTFSEVMSKRSG